LSYGNLVGVATPSPPFAAYNEYREKKENVRELQTVKSNLDKILRREPERGKGRENER